jgi:hypothetical protein
MEYLATFFTHSGAIKYQRFLRGKSVQAEALPVPRKFSSNCGIGVRFATEKDVRQYISEDMEKLYLFDSCEGRLIYENRDFI